MNRLLIRATTCILFTLQCLCIWAQTPAAAEQTTLHVLNHITGWTLDASGYHPSVFMLLENVSGRDLTGVTIKMQGKFTDMHTLEASTARLDIRRTLKPLQQFRISIISPRAYELPREISYWPRLDSKIMIRVGQVGDEGTENLLVTSIDSHTQTEEDAFQKLNELTSYDRHTTPHRPVANPVKHPKNTQPAKVEKEPPAQPLVATALKAQPVAGAAGNTVRDLLALKSLPGLGDDFYGFEQAFGLPQATDSKRKDFTWAKYKHQRSGQEIIVCSKDLTGKADMIVLQLPKNLFKSEAELFQQARSLAGKSKGQSLAHPVKSVRYLSSGRLEITTSHGTDYRMVSMSTPENGAGESAYILILTRLPQEASAMLLEQAKENPVLKGLPVVQL